MPGLVPGIQGNGLLSVLPWIAGTSPAMTKKGNTPEVHCRTNVNAGEREQTMFNRREYEPEYALLRNREPERKTNQWGKEIETAPEGSPLREEPFIVNGDEPGHNMRNPQRYKQHGFYFNADNCIGCHACETACAEKNQTPPHLNFRSVGIVECGTYPAYRRLNISMACNHCDDPVCLKGCPTRAYTKFAEYGAVLQDPDICFGCGYCTWVCPYNAPQLDPVAGHVSKCNMCVDRLEVGLKPACVAACLGNALDFGVIEDIPDNRVQAELSIPGFPDPNITHPNIRFQQMKTLEREVKRVDSMPVRYHLNEDKGRYLPEVDEDKLPEKAWNLKKLLTSHEMAHVAFTLSIQAVLGAFVLLVLGRWAGFTPIAGIAGSAAGKWLPWLMVAIAAFGLFKLNMHLGRPHRFYRGFYNLRLSPVSREIAGVSAFFAGLMGYAFFNLFDNAFTNALRELSAVLALAGTGFGGYYMYRLYRIKARPYWDHWHTGVAFLSTGLAGGVVLLALAALIGSVYTTTLGQLTGWLVAAALAAEAAALFLQWRRQHKASSEAAVSWMFMTRSYGHTFTLRLALMAAAFATALLLGLTGWPAALIPLALALFVEKLLGRALFFAVVVPTTMPGAYFWKNPGFIEHAREVGLADNPMVGVAHERHHPFRVGELIKTIRETTWAEKWDQFKRIFTG